MKKLHFFAFTCFRVPESLEYMRRNIEINNKFVFKLDINDVVEVLMVTSVKSPLTDQILENLQYQGSSNDCGPYTTATVINAMRGQDLVGDELAKQMNKPRWRGIFPVIRRVPKWATFPWGMIDVFLDFDLRGRWWFRVPISYLRPAINAGHILMPIIGEWRPKPWAHVMTLVAWDPEKGWGFANTQYRQKEIRWRSDQDFQEKWNNYARLLVEIKKP